MPAGSERTILNERYRGVVHWNTSEWRKDPDTGKRQRIGRPGSEWITHADESLRIVLDDLWERAQKRMRPAKADTRLQSGGKPKYLLSGLLRCQTCGAHYTLTAGKSYGCSSHHDGNACTNHIRIRRDAIQNALLGDLRDSMLAPDVVDAMAAEIEAEHTAWLAAGHAHVEQLPREVQDISARIDRLQERMKAGDPDLDADELQAAIDRADAKRRELMQSQPSARAAAKVRAILPKAAELYRRQIALGLDGDEREALKARVFLRDAFWRRNPSAAAARWRSGCPLEPEFRRDNQGLRDKW